MSIFDGKREKLPGGFEKKYKSERLKVWIADEGMWGLIPTVTGSMNSPYGIRRLEENDLLFSFIDEYFPDSVNGTDRLDASDSSKDLGVPGNSLAPYGRHALSAYAFEPDMRDGRYVFLPGEVTHQGMGICVSQIPGFLEICQFWYPDEYTTKDVPNSGAQISVCVCMIKPGPELAEMVKRVYIEGKGSDKCSFPFNPDIVVDLEGNFLDRLDESIEKIRTALKDAPPADKRNGEGLIGFMKWIMEQAVEDKHGGAGKSLGSQLKAEQAAKATTSGKTAKPTAKRKRSK